MHDDVLNAHCETIKDQPIVHNLLNSREEVSTNLRAKILGDDVAQTLTC